MNIRKFFTKKAVIVSVIILGLGGFAAAKFFGGPAGNDILTDVVRRQDIRRTILATGQVTSETDLQLSFKISGIVTSVNFKVGGMVIAGQIIATLDQKDQQAALTTARGSLAAAKANYQKILDGASSEEIQATQAAVNTAEVSLANSEDALARTIAEQDVLVANAYRTMLNTGLAAIPASTNFNSASPVISGTYTGTETGIYNITTRGNYFDVTGLEDSGSIYVSTTAPKSLGTKGLFVQFPSSYAAQNDSWTVEIPNNKASVYIVNYNAYQAALQTRSSAVQTDGAAVVSAKALVSQRKAELDLKKAKARPAELAAAAAQITSAEGQVQTALAALENTVVRAPAGGTITTVDVKVGELAAALAQAFILQNVKDLYLEANISEANISGIKIGQPVELTFDSFGADRVYEGKVQFLEPASTVVSGVVNYKIKASLGKLPEIRPGMTANMKILTDEKKAVLAVPQRAVISRGAEKFVRVITDPANAVAFREERVETGLAADGGLVEIKTGLAEGQMIVTFINKD